jgi:hypothetical protein
MRYAFLSAAAVAGLALSAGSASAQPGYRYGGFYGGPRYVAPAYGGFYSPGFYARPGVTLSYSPAFGLSFGYRSGPSWGYGGYPGWGYGGTPAYRYGYGGRYARPSYGYSRYRW